MKSSATFPIKSKNHTQFKFCPIYAIQDFHLVHLYITSSTAAIFRSFPGRPAWTTCTQCRKQTSTKFKRIKQFGNGCGLSAVKMNTLRIVYRLGRPVGLSLTPTVCMLNYLRTRHQTPSWPWYISRRVNVRKGLGIDKRSVWMYVWMGERHL